jgi:hypothetical protein
MTHRRAFIAIVIGAAVAPADQWREGTFLARDLNNGMVQWGGYIRGCFAVRGYDVSDHEDWISDRQRIEWNVTHIPSGYALGLWATTKAEAQRMVETLIAAGDWSHIDGQKHPDVERLKPHVMALRGKA